LANGGSGGQQTGATTRAGGPGGGGGGGYIATSQGTSPSSVSAAGGLGGSTPSLDMVAFPNNGATSGAEGTSNGTISARGGSIAACQPVDLTVTQEANPTTITLDQPFTTTTTVKNLGTGTALSASVEILLPPGVQITSTDAQGFACMQMGEKLVCTADSVDPGAEQKITLTMTPPYTSGALVVTAQVKSGSLDIDPKNNSAQVVIENQDPLIPRTAGGGLLGCSAAPSGQRTVPTGGAAFFGSVVSALLLLSARRRRRERALAE
jgi:hypothetical protein